MEEMALAFGLGYDRGHGNHFILCCRFKTRADYVDS